MSNPSRRLIRVLFPCGFMLLTIPSAFSQALSQEAIVQGTIVQGTMEEIRRAPESIPKAEPELPSPIYACWNLSYQVNGIGVGRELKLKGDQGALSSTAVNASTKQPEIIQQAVKVSDVDSDGWLRRQIFLWANRLKQRSTTEYELAQVKRQIESGSLKGAALEQAKQLQQTLQALLSDPNAQAVMLSAARADAVQRYRQSQQAIKAQTRSAEQQLDAQVGQRIAQIRSALNDKNQRSQLDDQIKQITAAINSGQLKTDQLAQAKSALRELQLLRSDPNSVNQRAKEFRDQQLRTIRNNEQTALAQAQTDLSKQMLIVDNLDNVLVVVTSEANRDQTRQAGNFSPQAFSLQLKDGNYSARTCNAQGECFPVEVRARSSR